MEKGAKQHVVKFSYEREIKAVFCQTPGFPNLEEPRQKRKQTRNNLFFNPKNNTAMSQKRPPIQNFSTPEKSYDNMTIHVQELAYLFREHCLGCKCEQPVALFKWDTNRLMLKRVCHHQYELSQPNKCGNKKSFFICIICGVVKEKEEQLHNHMSIHQSLIDYSKYCHFCKCKVECEDGFLEHLVQHIRISNFLDVEISNPLPTQVKKAFLRSTSENLSFMDSSNSASSSQLFGKDNDIGNISTTDDDLSQIFAQNAEYVANSQKMMDAINDPCEGKFKEFLKKIPGAPKN